MQAGDGKQEERGERIRNNGRKHITGNPQLEDRKEKDVAGDHGDDAEHPVERIEPHQLPRADELGTEGA